MSPSVRELLVSGTERLKPVAGSNARFTAEVILQSILDLRKIDLYLDPSRPVNALLEDEFWEKIERKLKREPLQYILGETEWFGLSFKCDPRALIPRPETEIIVERALELIKPMEKPEVLDLCTGTGAIAIAVAVSRTDARVIASDVAWEALELAAENLQTHGLEHRIKLAKGDLFEPIDPGARFGLIISNPPYITEAEYPALMPEVKNYEPPGALLAGEDGLDIIRKIVTQAPLFAKPEGWVIFECAVAQVDPIKELALQSTLYQSTEVIVDYDGQPRGFILQSR